VPSRSRAGDRATPTPGATWFALCLALILAGARTATAQIQVQVQLGDAEQPALDPTAGLEPPNDQDAARWLKRAAEAAEREDWKLAADTLERVIDQHGERTVSLDDDRHYASASSLAQDQIAAWPAEGLAAYRALYDPEANRLLTQARREHDLDALREIARKYPLATQGPEAIDLLAGWLIDRRQSSEAINLLRHLSRLPHGHVPPWRILQKRAIAHIVSGQRAQARRALDEMRELVTAGEASVPDDLPDRIEVLQRYDEDVKLGSRANAVDHETAVWPYRLGPPSGRGRMAEIQPVLAREQAWTAALPGAERLHARKVESLIRRRGRSPVWQAVSDGHRLFVTCPSGLIARDLATFDFLWQAFPKYRQRSATIERHRVAIMMRGLGSRDTDTRASRLDALSTQTLYHEYRGAVSTAFGLVFVIEQHGTPGEQRPTLQGAVPFNEHLAAESLAEPNALRAYEAATGRAVWGKGRGGPSAGGLTHAHFCGVPVPVGGRLIAPYLHGADLYLAVMKPDGTVLREVLVGSGRPGMVPMNGTLQPIACGGTLYVPTGAGLMVALNAYDLSLRWLTRYERACPKPRMVSRRRPWIMGGGVLPQADEWLSSPPVISRGRVILAPPDADEIFAFDQETGEQMWSAPRQAHRYVVGADAERVIVAGENVEAFDLETGASRWVYRNRQPTGRPALCDRSILVPTAEGLVRLDVTTGEPAGEILPTDAPLGNLLALDGSLYSLEVKQITKFPDPEKSKALAAARLAEDPNDVDAWIRLAWLATLTHDWRGALDTLDRAAEVLAKTGSIVVGPSEDEATRLSADEERSRISHARVEALLHLASEADGDARREHLTRARSSAVSTADRVKAGLAFCAYLGERDQHTEAFSAALATLRDVGDQPVKVDARHRVRADVLIAEQLRHLWRNMSDEQKSTALPEVDTLLSAAAARSEKDVAGRDLQTRLADNLGFLDCGAALDLKLGRHALDDDANETGIFFLRRAADRAARGPIALEALLWMAVAYRFPGEGLPAAPAKTAEVLTRLSEQYADAPLPAAFAGAHGLASSTTVGEFVGELTETLPAGLAGAATPIPTILRTATRLGLLMEADVPQGMFNDAAVFWDRSRRHDIYARVLPVTVSRQIRGLEADEGGREGYWWSSDLEPPPEDAELLGLQASYHRPGVVAGRVAVLQTTTGLSAIGLASGRAMWAPLPVDRAQGPLPTPAVVDIGGIVVAAADANTLVAIAARDSARPIWRRLWPRRTMRILRAVAGRLLVVDRNATRVFVIDPSGGRITREYALSLGPAPDTAGRDDIEVEDPDAHVAIVNDVVCRSGHKVVVGRDAVSGRVLWNCELPGSIQGLFELDRRHLGVSHGTSQFRVVDAATGEAVKDITTDGLLMPPRDAVVDFPTKSAGGGQLLLFTATDDVLPEYVLQPFSLKGDDPPWGEVESRTLGPIATISPQMMRASPDYIAVIRNEPGEPGVDRSLPPRLEIVSKATGLRMGPRPYEFEEGQLGEGLHRSRIISDVIVLDERIVAAAPEGIFVLADVNRTRKKNEKSGD